LDSISDFRLILNVVFFLLVDSPPSEVYLPMFRNSLSVPSSEIVWAKVITGSRAEPSRAEPSRAEPSRAEPSQAKPSRANILTGDVDLREMQVDVPLSVAIPAFDRIFVLSNRHLDSKHGLCLR